ncbi:uncharacterized protein LOC118218310 isoform X3 [Anguilla anguilla]|uniref:uncharacterized protein LOC118218310 isoform X3 n=1 Tax=Anguilla anguilla TaxID=7936 RepID=UPI0015AE537A|nr:uncharacterized protein LOC118218310 isoform X3 [Anguilla anguilla]
MNNNELCLSKSHADVPTIARLQLQLWREKPWNDGKNRSDSPVALGEPDDIVTLSLLPPSQASTTFHFLNSSPSVSECDTNILSSPESTSSSHSTSSRSAGWPSGIFPVPRFSYDAELELEKANAAFQKDGTLLNPRHKLKCAILDGLKEEILKFKIYPNASDFADVASALVKAHPCLREPGSASGYDGWKVSLQWKFPSFRRQLQELETPERTVNALKNKPDGKCSPAYRVKKLRRAEVNYCPNYPSGETTETLEQMRVLLLAEVNKRHNEENVKKMMDKTFALRRWEILQDCPMVADFKLRWPALFQVNEVEAEFKRITTVHLQSQFFSRLDLLADSLMRLYAKKGGVAGRKIRSIMARMTQNETINIKHECVLRGLCVYLNEDPEHLVKEYKATGEEDFPGEMAEMAMAIFVITHEGAEPGDNPENIGIFMEGVEVLSELSSLPLAVAMLLGLTYTLNLSYPSEHRYTFEALQKVVMQTDDKKLSTKVQTLKNKLSWQSH